MFGRSQKKRTEVMAWNVSKQWMEFVSDLTLFLSLLYLGDIGRQREMSRIAHSTLFMNTGAETNRCLRDGIWTLVQLSVSMEFPVQNAYTTVPILKEIFTNEHIHAHKWNFYARLV